MALSAAKLARKHVGKLERDNAKLLATLRALADYCGGSDLPKSHPLGAAHLLLREFDSAKATSSESSSDL